MIVQGIVKSPSRQRGLWKGLLTLAVLGGFVSMTPPAAEARARHSDSWAREHFAAANRLREALNGRPLAERTHRDYQRVLNSYRIVYRGAPASSKADPSVVAVAETLVEMGRRFEDDKILHEAIEQYKFLRHEYPGSKYRFDALFTIGEIYQDDLQDPEAARSSFQDFVRHYPHNHLADDARQAITELDRQAKKEKPSRTPKTAEKKSSAEKMKPEPIGPSQRDLTAESKAPREQPEAREKDKDREDKELTESSGPRPGQLPRVTGIRHWSTPNYTRVAIDLDGNVKFSSQRISRPARIFFDLRDTKLASTLVGKTFDVDDGFLKKVRVAQFAPRRTRIVLEVDNLSDYDAFILPNPSRLIIDIHGKNSRAGLPKGVDEPANADDTESANTNADAKPIPEAEAGSNPSTADTTALAHAALSAKSASAATGTGDSGVSSAAPPSLSDPPQTAIVKKIVDADADDEDDAAASSAEATGRNTRELKSAISKKRAASDLDSGSDTSDPVASLGARNTIGGSQRKTTSRALVGRTTDSDLDVREARPTLSGDRSLIRALGLKIGRIVIDPGHGGHDTGTIGPNGLEEKDLVLDVGRRLGKLLETRLGAEVVYTRKNDTFIPLETRTAIANQARADLFVSIHANSSHDSAARGVETYYLNFTSSPEALEVAARENAVSEASIYELQDLVKKIALKEKIEESREFAWDVQQSLHTGLAAKSPAIRDRGVKKAPFIVLIGANMPSILAEISFVSNPTDEHRLSTSEYRQRIAESLYRGIAKYVNGLSGVKVASKIEKASGQ